MRLNNITVLINSFFSFHYAPPKLPYGTTQKPLSTLLRCRGGTSITLPRRQDYNVAAEPHPTSTTHETNSPCFLFRHPTERIRNIFLQPFTNHVWWCILICGILTILAIAKITHEEQRLLPPPTSPTHPDGGKYNLLYVGRGSTQ